MNEPELHRIVQEAVCETLLRLGISTDAPSEMQADMIFLRKSRKGNEEVAKWVKRTTVGVFVSSLLFTLYEGIRHILK